MSGSGQATCNVQEVLDALNDDVGATREDLENLNAGDIGKPPEAPLPPEKPKRPEAPIPLPPKPDKLTDKEQALWLALEARHAGDLLLYEANRIKFETEDRKSVV